jgi:hypothetical protein
LVGKATTDTLTNKTLTTPVISTISNTGTLTLPTSTDTLVGRATTDTLTNKTLTTPVISSLSSASATALTLQSAGTTAITVDTSQRIGMGTASPSAARLQVVGVTGGYVQKLNNVNSTRVWAFGVDAVATDDGIFVVDDVTAGANRLAINTNGAIALSGASKTATGVGITFPATQSASSDANTLDDYEEGTYTPAVQGTSTNPTVTYSIQKGQYTKVGNRVFISFDVAWSAFTGGSGSLAVTVPFAITNAQLGGNFSFGYVSGLSSNTLTGYNDPGNAYFYLTNSTSTNNNLNVSTAGASGRITGVGSYQV